MYSYLLHNVGILDPILESLLIAMVSSILVQIMTFLTSSYSHLSHAYRAFVASLQMMPIPRDWRCTKQDPNWNVAMREDMHALQKNKTWELFPLPRGKKLLAASGSSL